MTLPRKQLHVRLTDDVAKKFDELTNEFPNLQATVLLRLLVSSVLERPKSEQIETVIAALRNKSIAPKQAKAQRPTLNAKNRISES